MSEKQLSFEGAMKIVGEQKWILIKDIERLEKFIQNQQATISALKEENEQLKEEIEILKQKEKVLNKIWRSYLEKGDITDSTCIRFVGDDDD